MKISELRARENYDENLKSTIQVCLEIDNELDGMNIDRIQNLNEKTQISWFEHPFFSVYVTKDFCAEGRQYLRGLYRHSPRGLRRIIQAPMVDVMSSGLCFNQMLKYAFVLQKCRNDEMRMWMPGNHRFRQFDFEKRTVRVYPKHGFSLDGIQREIAIRKRYCEQFSWMLPVLVTNHDDTAFEEPLIDAIPFDRVSGTVKRNAIISHAAKELHRLHQCEAREMHSSEYLALKRSQFVKACERMHEKFPGVLLNKVEELWNWAESVIRKANVIQVSLTHGDFQPGNVLVSRENTDNIWFIDWEDADIRATVYDAMTWLFQSRFPQGLASRIKDFGGISIQDQELLADCCCDEDLCRALWVIEEWIWLLESSSRDGIVQLPVGICQHFVEIGQFLRMISVK